MNVGESASQEVFSMFFDYLHFRFHYIESLYYLKVAVTVTDSNAHTCLCGMVLDLTPCDSRLVQSRQCSIIFNVIDLSVFSLRL